ncbi:hypothetical protein KY495_19805 [Massilia sp. PAMC28688]|uniref:DUF5985 family protein n=1 Tax=Massilia sp. PAMC28688 TaxID=2861283 RepID=UPI001C62D7CF|nr:DUF5985 family protein [Massilia sp. PAMC28688]QYF92933.1 hypothetical protein KY495_19805 [Massilia sp. PAMC28688]
MTHLLAGAIAMGSMIIALFFLRFWRDTKDRFFLYFALSFMIEGAHRVYGTLEMVQNEASPLQYLIRLAAYALILWAILEKNLPQRKNRP